MGVRLHIHMLHSAAACCVCHLLPPPPAGDEAAAAAMGRESEPMDEPGWPQPLCLRRRGSELGDQELEMEFVHAVAAVNGGPSG